MIQGRLRRFLLRSLLRRNLLRRIPRRLLKTLLRKLPRRFLRRFPRREAKTSLLMKVSSTCAVKIVLILDSSIRAKEACPWTAWRIKTTPLMRRQKSLVPFQEMKVP